MAKADTEKGGSWSRATKPEREAARLPTARTNMTQEPLEIWKSGDFLEIEMVPMRGDGDDASSSNLWHLRILAALRSDTSST